MGVFFFSVFFFFKQKTAYEMRISDWSSDVCSSDLMARRVSDNELALFGREEAISDVDGDSLLTLRGEAVDEKREVDILTLRTHALAVGFECGKLILEDHLAVIEQATDEGGFAVINAAASDETQQRLV